MFVGIDNGLKGGMTAIDDDGKVIKSIPMPVITTPKGKSEYNIVEIKEFLIKFAAHTKTNLVGLEKAQAFPGQGVTSTFSTGKGYGMFIGLLSALNIPFTVVAPQTWQGAVFVGLNRGDSKQASILFAQRMSPQTNWKGTERSKKFHDGMTDSFCIATYIKQIYGKSNNAG